MIVIGLLSGIQNLHDRDRDQRTNLVESTDETEEGTSGSLEVAVPLLHVLDSVEKHTVYTMLARDPPVLLPKPNVPIVTGGSRGNAKNDGEEVELAKTGLLTPVDSLKLRSLLLGDLGRRSLGLLIEDAHGDGWLVCELDDGL